MRYLKLGRAGLEVSALCLGCMSVGEPSSGTNAWTLDLDESRPIIRAAIEAGINFFDTANMYSAGTSEEIVGRLLKECGQHDEIVLTTKVYHRMRSGPNGSGLSRKAIMAELDASLRRLDVDYIDLYQIHRWDDQTPIEETLETLHDVVTAGKVRYLGASTMHAWQFSKAQYLASANGWTRFVSMQNHYNLLYREEEREMLPLCEDLGIGVLPWSPLARGKLTRPWKEETSRTETDPWGRGLYVESDQAIVQAVIEVARQRGVPPAQVALAWVSRNPMVTAPIVGVTKPRHLEDAVASLDLELDPVEVSALEAPYGPHDPAGF